MLFAFGVQQDVRTRLNAGAALRRIERHAGLQHQKLPARRTVVVELPAHAAEHRSRQEHRAAPPAVQPQLTNRMTEAQIEVDSLYDECQGYARQRRGVKRQRLA